MRSALVDFPRSYASLKEKRYTQDPCSAASSPALAEEIYLGCSVSDISSRLAASVPPRLTASPIASGSLRDRRPDQRA